VISYARKMGINSLLSPHLSLALGSHEVSLLELTSAYAVVANEGISTRPYAILRIEDKTGRILEENYPEEEEALDSATAYVMTKILEGVIQRGTGYYARRLKRPAAGKTGTTNDYTDAWFIGFTPQLTVGVWVGYDDYRSLGMSGGRLACPIWTEFMKKILEKEPVVNFSLPQKGVKFVKIDPKTGLLALPEAEEAYLEVFLEGTEPKNYAWEIDFSTFTLEGE
jgi:penicillin-binding protein 1A